MKRISVLLLAAFMFLLSCRKETSIPAPSVDIMNRYYAVVTTIIHPVHAPGQAQRVIAIDTPAYIHYAEQTTLLFKDYMKTNNLTQPVAVQQWATAMKSCIGCNYLMVDDGHGSAPPINGSSPCESRAWIKFAGKQATCLSMSLIPVPVIAWTASLSCLISAGAELTADLDDCRRAAAAAALTPPTTIPK